MAGTRCIHIFLTELNGTSGDLSAINDRNVPVEDLSVIRFADEADISPNGVGPCLYPAIAETLSLPTIRFRQLSGSVSFHFVLSDCAGMNEMKSIG